MIACWLHFASTWCVILLRVDLVASVCLVVSGVNHPTDQQRILDWLRYTTFFLAGLLHYPCQIYIKNDAIIALASGTMGKLHGCVLITAIGTIAYPFSEDGGEARAVSSGLVLGDWGSGYGIVAHALTVVIKAHDGRGAQTMLVSSILESIGLSSPDELISDNYIFMLEFRWTYADPSWARIATLHKHLYKCMPKFVDLSFRHLVSFGDYPCLTKFGIYFLSKRIDLGLEIMHFCTLTACFNFILLERICPIFSSLGYYH
ncbi:hypothetical protein UlMin_043022 [Ulmus minor]